MTELGVNIDHVATLRQARMEGIPDIIKAAGEVKKGGASGITIHLREDRRHIQDSDLYNLKEENILPINLEMAAADEIVNIALDVIPQSACLVPEKREELTTEGGLDVSGNLEKITDTVEKLQDKGIEVSLFIDPDKKQIEAASKSGADTIEIHTGAYANAPAADKKEHVKVISEAAHYALEKKLKVNAGHGLDYENIEAIENIGIFSEFNIGYSIICHAVFVGLKEAVRQMKALIS